MLNELRSLSEREKSDSYLTMMGMKNGLTSSYMPKTRKSIRTGYTI